MKLKICTILAFIAITAMAQPRRGGSRGAVSNPNGGITAASGYGGSGAKGKYERTAVATSDGQGNAKAASQGKFSGTNGSQGRFSRKSTVNADGSATSTGSSSASGSKGSFDSSGTSTRSADGTINSNRATNASSAKGSYSGSTAYNTGSGVNHSATCKDSSGNTIPCPAKSK